VVGEDRADGAHRAPEAVQPSSGATRQVPLATPFGRLAHERGGKRGVILSAAVHLGAAGLLLWSGTRLVMDDRAPGPGHGKGGGGGGGGNRTVVLYEVAAAAQPAPPPPTAAVVVPVVPAVVIPVPLPVDTAPHAPAPALAAAGAGPGEGAGKGPGTGPGAGGGTGGGSGGGVGPGTGPDSGGGGRIYLPQPQGIIMPPPDRPSSLHGVTIAAVFEISASGEVLHVALDPMPRDRKFANEFLERLRRFTFTPAHTLDGRPVAALYRINITL
jgi:hypothetical protein